MPRYLVNVLLAPKVPLSMLLELPSSMDGMYLYL